MKGISDETKRKEIENGHFHLALIIFVSHLPYFLISSFLLISGAWYNFLDTLFRKIDLSLEVSFYAFTFLIVYLLFMLIGKTINVVERTKKTENSGLFAILELVAMPYTIMHLNPVLTMFTILGIFMANIFNGNSISCYLFIMLIHIIFLRISRNLMLKDFLKILRNDLDEEKKDSK